MLTPHSHSSFLVFCCAFLVGCGHGDGRQAVRGRVTLDGQPLLNGAISFRPLGHRANSAGTAARNGAFEIPASKGLMPGKYEVEIQAFRETGLTIHDPQRGDMPELAPIRFQPDALQPVVVRENCPNVFDLHSQSAE